SLQVSGNLFQGFLLYGQRRQRGSLPVRRWGIQESLRVFQDHLMQDFAEPPGISTEDRPAEIVFLGQPEPADSPGVLQVPTVDLIELVKVQVVARNHANRLNAGSAEA